MAANDLMQITDDLFFGETDLDQSNVDQQLRNALSGADDGEMYLEYTKNDSVLFDDGKVKTASYATNQGFGLRSVAGEKQGYAHSGLLTPEALTRAVETVKSTTDGYSGTMDAAPSGTNQALYTAEDPMASPSFANKVELLAKIDAYARAKDPRVVQVSANLSTAWKAIQIRRADGQVLPDVRPMVSIRVSVVMEKDGRRESGSFGYGGRKLLDPELSQEKWQHAVNEAIRMAGVNLESVPAPAGEMTVVLGPGWPGVLLHEAVGHGLEGDFNRKGTSLYSGMMGEMVAAPGVTIVDDGTIADRRGSLSIDDEGTASGYNTLIEAGRLVGYMQDRLNARLMGVRPTGNGRRESYAHLPMPRMTNTYMLAGDRNPQEILSSVDKGVYAVNFGGGQVDITNGQFTFQCTEAYEIDNGKIGRPLKGATLIGNGPEVMRQVSMVGDDLALDEGIGVCGKNGQGVPVGLGQPTLKIDRITVGGTA